MNYAKKYHYMIKYLIIGFPFIIVCLFCFLQNNEIFTKILNELIKVFDNLASWSFNTWYSHLLLVLDVDLSVASSSLYGLLLYYPLYVMWVYIFDLILDLFCLLPKLAHRLMDKLSGGDKY